jgi:8-oxo-dGTP diphosphatase
MMPVLKHKVFAYITHGPHLLVFRHPEAPEAGIQVPAGTVRAGEDLAAAVLREATEETGRTDLVLVRFLGEQVLDRQDRGLDEIHHRHFYHLRCTGDPPATWRHWESDPSDGSPGPIPFDFFWARLPDGVPELIADHGKLLPQLLATLERDA